MPNETWFPKYKNEMLDGARNNNLCSYLVALEGWRRGLTLTWYSHKVRKGIHAPGRAYSLSSATTTHHFYKSKGDRVNNVAVKIGGNKEKTKEVLKENGVRVPIGKRFTQDSSDDDIISYALQTGFPLVIKPTNGYQGNGVISNITTVDYFKQSLKHIRDTLNYLDVIVEEYIKGEEYRVFVIEDEVVSVINRRPASVVGNGKDAIEKLIRHKNIERKKNPRLSSCLIHIDFEIENYLKITGRSLEDIPKYGDRVFLREISNISRGGDSIEVRDTFPEEVKQVAIKALKSLPGIPHGGVDVMIDENKPIAEAGTVIEINGIPQIGSLVFPMIGQARDIPGKIIDYYFPETKSKEDYNEKLYFDFSATLSPLRSKVASEITVIPVPQDVTQSVMYVVKGKVQNVGYRRWIRRQALQNDLHGYAQNRNNGDVHVVVSGSQENLLRFKEICKQGPKNAKVEEVQDQKWNKSIKVGFEIRNTQKRKPKSKAKPKKKPLTFTQKIKRKIKKIIS